MGKLLLAADAVIFIFCIEGAVALFCFFKGALQKLTKGGAMGLQQTKFEEPSCLFSSGGI
jgi:hypothetical protein